VDGTIAAREEHGIGIFRPSEAHLGPLSEWFVTDYESLLRFAYFLTRDQSTAEDLVQEAFVRVSSAADRLEEEGLPGYARRTIVNLHTSAYRRRRIEERVLGLFRLRGAAQEAADVASTLDMRHALMSLSVRQRACLALRYYDDLKEADIATTMDMSLAAVKKEIERAKKRLRVALGERGDDEAGA
jgi:RNA polymerase sigma factor (sigma-70 family)